MVKNFTFIALVIIIFGIILIPFNVGLALTIPQTPTPIPSTGPDYSNFGSGLGNSSAGIAIGAGGCIGGVLLGLFGGSVDIYYCIDNFVIRPVMRTISNSIENTMLNQMGAIVTDKLGQGKDPHFVTDWRNLILNSNARGNDIFRSVLADTELCPHFGDNLKQVFGADVFNGVIKNFNGGTLTDLPGEASFQYLNKCSLSSDIDVEVFKDDFTQGGGWSAWYQLLKPENNPQSVFNQALEEKSKQITLEEQASEDEALAGDGFLPSRAGTDGTNKPSSCAANGLTRCIFQAKSITPGKLFGDTTARILDQKFETIGGAQEIQDLILALTDSVINKLSGRLSNFLGSGSPASTTPGANVSSSICMANCEIKAQIDCSGSLVLMEQTLACVNRVLTACQQACPR